MTGGSEARIYEGLLWSAELISSGEYVHARMQLDSLSRVLNGASSIPSHRTQKLRETITAQYRHLDKAGEPA